MPKHCWHLADRPEPSTFEDVRGSRYGLSSVSCGDTTTDLYYWHCCFCGRPLDYIGSRQRAQIPGHGTAIKATQWVDDRSLFDGECPARQEEARA